MTSFVFEPLYMNVTTSLDPFYDNFAIPTDQEGMFEDTPAENEAEVVYVADPKLLSWCDAVPVFRQRVGSLLVGRSAACCLSCV